MIDIEQILQGTGLYPHIRIQIVNYYNEGMQHYYRTVAKQNKMRLSDWLIMNCTKRISNTKIARKLYRDKIIKPYPENAEYIRIMK